VSKCVCGPSEAAVGAGNAGADSSGSDPMQVLFGVGARFW
jgi:hypothetical protein